LRYRTSDNPSRRFRGKVLKEEMRQIEQVRAKYDDQILATDGVESVSVGLNEQGEACLMLGTSLPVEQVRARLPKDIFKVPVKITYIGEISAQ